MNNIISTILITGIITIVLGAVSLKFFAKRNILDSKKRATIYGRKRVPTLQWIALLLGFVISTLIISPALFMTPLFQWLLRGSVALVSLAVRDEKLVYFSTKKTTDWPIKVGISGTRKLAIQILISLAVIRFTGIRIEAISLGNILIELPLWIDRWLSTLRFIICINAINLFDGIDSQTSGVATIGYITIWWLIARVVIPFFPDIDPERLATLGHVQQLSLILIVISFIYTIIEYKPYGLIRDAGTLFFGFSLAYLSLIGWAKVGTMLVVLSLVILDVIRVLIHRLLVLKTNPLQGDTTHIHHRLLRMWRTRGEVRVFVRTRSAIMMIFMLLQWVNTQGKIIIFVMMATIFFGVNIYLFRIKKLPVAYKITTSQRK